MKDGKVGVAENNAGDIAKQVPDSDVGCTGPVVTEKEDLSDTKDAPTDILDPGKLRGSMYEVTKVTWAH